MTKVEKRRRPEDFTREDIEGVAKRIIELLEPFEDPVTKVSILLSLTRALTDELDIDFAKYVALAALIEAPSAREFVKKKRRSA